MAIPPTLILGLLSKLIPRRKRSISAIIAAIIALAVVFGLIPADQAGSILQSLATE